MIGPKQPIWRSRPYLMYVASHDCFACGISEHSQAAHANFGKGRSLKVSDALTFPLCAPRFGLMGCHYQHDNLIDMTRDERRELEERYVERMQGQAAVDGWKLPGAQEAA